MDQNQLPDEKPILHFFSYNKIKFFPSNYETEIRSLQEQIKPSSSNFLYSVS